uniref:RING-type E3 ubiquitin transferase n=1 Tax=Salarias fasciatus TaxID=181472 RepID=A0A672HKB7_SALFA
SSDTVDMQLPAHVVTQNHSQKLVFFHSFYFNIIYFNLGFSGHYRYAEALFFVGQPQLAFSANSRGQELCKEDQEARRDLAAQQQKFIDALLDSDGTANIGFFFYFIYNNTQRLKELHLVISLISGLFSESSSKNNKAESNNAAKKKAKNRNPPAENKVRRRLAEPPSLGQTQEMTRCLSLKQKETDGKSEVCKKLRSAVQDAHAALVDLRSRNAEQAFSQALALLETTTPKVSRTPLSLFHFICARLFLQELAEAQKVLEKMKSYEDRTFQCLVYYAVGRVFFRENKFAVALEQFSNSMQMVKNQITPGKLTWPLTKEVVKETQPQYFKEHLKSAIESCRFPPPPDAICRLDKCLSSVKPEIFFTDPDFKGFIQMCCCKSCMVEYHMTCWKSLKSSVYNEKNEKDFLHEPCLTPDCIGLICNIKIYGPTGLVKCKVRETSGDKARLKKLKSKEERKTKRKLHKQSDSASSELVLTLPSPLSAWLLYRDRVLLQISQKLDLLREEKGLDVVALTGSLKPWLELDSSRGNQVAAQILGWQQEQQTVGRAVELLLERKNRVWARVFVHHLSGRSDLNPKLSTWACQLNDAGLNAARSFIERHADHLEQLDLALLLNFAPLQEMVIEKFGTRPELFSSIGLTVTEYLRQAQPQDMRLFIWTLEEHREDYVSCHTLLDEYFDMMVSLMWFCFQNSPMKTKNRGRKKKQREQRVRRRVLSGKTFFCAISLKHSLLSPSFLDPVDPFTVPSHLRGQVADFEDQYHSTRHRGHLKMILDNNPDLTKESLYDYFAQILDEHGPLLATDPLLVGELLYFPLEARDKIEQAGGFEAFLLDSLRFIKIGECIGLAKHAVALYHSSEVRRVLPNPYAPEFKPAGMSNFIPWSNGDDQQAVYYLPSYYEGENLYICDAATEVVDSDPTAEEEYSKVDAAVQVSAALIYVFVSELKDHVRLHPSFVCFFPVLKVTNKELVLFQQKLEEEVKKDQKEKKANQETLKSLKQEIDELLEEQGSSRQQLRPLAALLPLLHLLPPPPSSLQPQHRPLQLRKLQPGRWILLHTAPCSTKPWTAWPACSPTAPGNGRSLWTPHWTQLKETRDLTEVNFLHVFRSQLRKFVQQLRSSSGGSLSSMALQDVVSGAAQLILDHQVGRDESPSDSTSDPAEEQQLEINRICSSGFISLSLNAEDPCIICHEDMNPADIHVLECRHSFHHQCIKSWLKEQSTCPTCRNHALMNDEFPALIGRRRPAP